MPEGKMRTPVERTIDYLKYTRTNVQGYAIHTFYVSGDSYLELPLDANVRLPTEKSIPYKEMCKTLIGSQELFFLQNSGISVIASRVDVTNSRNKVKLTFPMGSGIVNGGHTQLALLDTKGQRSIGNAVLKIDVIEHTFSAKELAFIAASRNTASNVKPYSTAEKKGYFLKIKNEMQVDIEKHIIWYENREVPNDRGLGAIDLIGRLNLFNIKKFQSEIYLETDQPNKSATSKTSVFKDWENHQEEYLHTYPLVNEIINLEEHIVSTFHRGISKGFTTLKVVKKASPSARSTFFGKKVSFQLPIQFLLPILASFRAVIKYDEPNGKIGWCEDPEKVFDKTKKNIFDSVQKTFKSTYHNEINRASKDSNLWQILYMNVSQKVNRSGSGWAMKNVPIA